jgi:hypothetical protein
VAFSLIPSALTKFFKEVMSIRKLTGIVLSANSGMPLSVLP